jgi:type VI protein secretion system component Hcp
MFPINLLRRSSRDHVATKDDRSRSRRVRARRNPVGLEPLEERQLLTTDIFMLVPGVTGSATASFAPKGSFELTSFAWGVSHPQTLGAGGFSGSLSAPNFSITKSFDSASIGLLGELANGKVNSTGAKVLVFKSGATAGGFVEELEYDFTREVVTSVQLSSSSGGDTPAESDTFSFTKVSVTEWTQTPSGGQGTPITVTINFAALSPGTIALSTLTAGVGASGSLANTADGHAAARVHGSHKAKAAGLNHGLAAHKLHVTQLAKSHRISAVAQSSVHGN